MNINRNDRALLIRLGKSFFFGAAILITTMLVRAFALTATPSTAAFCFMIVVLVSAFFADLTVAIVVSVIATLCFDYYFLPPFGTFNIAAFSDWISLLAFLVASILISQLTASASENRTAVKRLKIALEQLKKFQGWLLDIPSDKITLSGIAAEAVRAFSLEYCSIHVFREGKWEHFSGGAESTIPEDIIKVVQDHPRQISDFAEESLMDVKYIPIKKGDSLVALLAIKSRTLPPEIFETIAYVTGIRINSII
jgi:two-component system sensor histidine kinase KdpD